MSNATRLSSTVTVERYQQLERDDDRQELARFVRERFDERYFRPIESAPRELKHGFASMAIGCLVVETLESFYQGLGDTKSRSKKMFRDFFARDTQLKVFAGHDDWFYKDIRCGLLHQAEARNGWRILRQGPLLEASSKKINATAFLRELRKLVEAYARDLTDDQQWILFKRKMKAVCKNCQ